MLNETGDGDSTRIIITDLLGNWVVSHNLKGRKTINNLMSLQSGVRSVTFARLGMGVE